MTHGEDEIDPVGQLSSDIIITPNLLTGMIERERRFLSNLRLDWLDDVMIEDNSPGTCEWILSSSEFEEWLSGSHNILWIQGQPGAGKTVVAKFLYRQLCGVFEVDAAKSGAHIPHWASIASSGLSRPRQIFAYFFDVNSPLRNSGLSVLHSLIFQVLSTKQNLFKYLHGKSVFSKPEQGDFSQWAEVLSAILRDPSLEGTIIVLDALDECEPASQHEIFDVLSALADQAKIRLLVTSRPQDGFQPDLLLDLSGCVENVNLDVQRYIETAISQLAVLRGFAVSLENEITQQIIAHPSKSFLWAQLVIHGVSRAKTLRMIRERLEHLPRDLLTAYSHFLDGLSGSTDTSVRRALYFVMVTNAPLQIKDLSALLAILQSWDHPHISTEETVRKQSKSNDIPLTSDLKEITENQTIDFERHFREHFQPLLSLKENSVSVVHFSLREFLETSSEVEKFHVPTHLQSSLGYYADDLRKVHGIVAALCLQYILAAFHGDGDPLDFQAFACANWTKHAREAGGSRNYHLEGLVRMLFSKENDYAASWLSKLAGSQATRVALLPLKADIAFVLAAFDLCTHFGDMLSVSVKTLQSTDQGQRTPLHLAAANDSRSSIHWIQDVLSAEGLELGDLATRKDSKGESPIFLAAQNGHEELTKLLLKSMKWKYEFDSRLFRTIAESGNMAMFAILYEYTNIESPEQSMSLLTDAAVFNNVVLLEKIISDHDWTKASTSLATLRDSSGNPLLHIALRMHATAVVVFLLDRGCPPTATDENGNTALHVAVQKSDEKILKRLIDHGVSVKTFNKSGETALHIASETGLPGIVRFLCFHGGNVNLADASGRTPAHLAAEAGREEVITILLECGINVNTTDKSGRSALHIAAGAGHASTLATLVKAGADVNARDYEGRAPVHYAIASGDLGLLYMLCEAGADLSISDFSHITPLHLAANRGSEILVRELLALGTDPNVQDQTGRTPLHYSCLSKQSSVTIARILLDGGANVQPCDHNKIAPIHLAAEQGFDTIVRELVLSGADLDSRDLNGKTALDYAFSKNNLVVIELLRELRPDMPVKIKTENENRNRVLAGIGFGTLDADEVERKKRVS